MAKIITNGAKSGHIDGTSKADTINGEGGNDNIGGHKGDDIINGGAGNDRLHGGQGHDVLTGGSGKDVFVFKEYAAADSDRVTDFTHGTDKIGIDGTYLTAFKDGKFSSSEFYAGTKAHDANDHLIYDKKTGKLYYDDDGNGKHAAHLIATFDHKPTITASDFTIFLD